MECNSLGFPPVICAHTVRLSMVLILRMFPDRGLGILAPVCSSFVFMNRKNNQRSWMFPLGCAQNMTVIQANLMANRRLRRKSALYCSCCCFLFSDLSAMLLYTVIAKGDLAHMAYGRPRHGVSAGAALLVGFCGHAAVPIFLHLHLQGPTPYYAL